MSSSKSSSSSSEVVDAGSCPAHLEEATCRVEIILGTGTMSVRDCLALDYHSVIRLSQAAGANLQVVANGIAIANGEVVIMDDTTSIRITSMTAPPSRGR